MGFFDIVKNIAGALADEALKNSRNFERNHRSALREGSHAREVFDKRVSAAKKVKSWSSK